MSPIISEAEFVSENLLRGGGMVVCGRCLQGQIQDGHYGEVLVSCLTTK